MYHFVKRPLDEVVRPNLGQVDEAAVTKLARNLAVLGLSLAAPLLPDAIDRRTERQRADIRLLLGFRKLGMGVRINALA